MRYSIRSPSDAFADLSFALAAEIAAAYVCPALLRDDLAASTCLCTLACFGGLTDPFGRYAGRGVRGAGASISQIRIVIVPVWRGICVTQFHREFFVCVICIKRIANHRTMFIMHIRPPAVTIFYGITSTCDPFRIRCQPHPAAVCFLTTKVIQEQTDMDGKFVSYLRVSTERQGKSGLGLEAQREAVARYLNGGSWHLTAEFVEVETGKRSDRPQLAEALALCRLTGATLVVAKLDRLARNARFLLTIVEGAGEGGVVFCDLPQVPPGPAGKFMLTQFAAVAELEAGLISQRTKAALTAAKARGKALGGWRGGPKVASALGRAALAASADSYARTVGPLARDLRDQGMSLRQIGATLAARGIKTPRGGQWTPAAVAAVLARLAAQS